ncbi:hypothetical protein CCACVL1_29292 [Corchorus capsularis]|uniref:Uncharacterized protein n=1 Tax=Corchorus capsularis TaxID=210143 RepID=A0A1R3G2F4_COCAP|nr:hypothetical protein CCACVL1_29292 [Corchorus capsularis]
MRAGERKVKPSPARAKLESAKGSSCGKRSEAEGCIWDLKIKE